MKAEHHARVWQDVTSTLRTRATIEKSREKRAVSAIRAAPGFQELKAKRTATLIFAMAEFTEIVSAAYREEAERDGPALDAGLCDEQ